MIFQRGCDRLTEHYAPVTCWRAARVNDTLILGKDPCASGDRGRLPMEPATDRVPESLSSAFDIIPPATSPLDPSDTLDLHRAINERRAQMENPEMLRRLRSL